MGCSSRDEIAFDLWSHGEEELASKLLRREEVPDEIVDAIEARLRERLPPPTWMEVGHEELDRNRALSAVDVLEGRERPLPLEARRRDLFILHDPARVAGPASARYRHKLRFT